ncbi:hypothetical protein RRG08_038042 [Elysia crispata]|uniref:Uncharacterized protein n=1 Tax=Elysia crispata TaxID=231223 RepID=A0AAE1A060_9GAST|nr:hypothetical protein RRG08_038042 [Elysia crispata]
MSSDHALPPSCCVLHQQNLVSLRFRLIKIDVLLFFLPSSLAAFSIPSPRFFIKPDRSRDKCRRPLKASGKFLLHQHPVGNRHLAKLNRSTLFPSPLGHGQPQKKRVQTRLLAAQSGFSDRPGQVHGTQKIAKGLKARALGRATAISLSDSRPHTPQDDVW